MDDNKPQDPPKRKRSLTELTLGWFAERMKKTEAIKAAIEGGQYSLDSRKIAESLVSEEKHQ